MYRYNRISHKLLLEFIFFNNLLIYKFIIYMFDILLAFIHLLFTLFICVYVFCIKNKKYDYFYLTYIYFLLLHWTFLKGECILSYLYKKMQYNDYILGSYYINDDFDYLLSKYKSYVYKCINILMIVNIYMVCKRNNIKNYTIFMFILLYVTIVLSYMYSFNNFNNLHINKNFQLVNDILKKIIICFGLYIYINKDNMFII